MKKCIVTFGRGHNFLKGVNRLKEQCNSLSIPFFGFTEYPKGCPTHQESPFAFKFFCIEECYKQGYTNILWTDACVILKDNVWDVFDIIENRGYFFVYNHELGSWCHDKALVTLSITREQSFELPCLQGTNFGLNLNFEKSRSFLKEMLRLSVDGITFPGPHNNNEKKASRDSRVNGHRHDQTAMSVVALRNNMNEWCPGPHQPWFIHDREYVKSVISTVVDVDMSL